jgi:hypothetical protein
VYFEGTEIGQRIDPRPVSGSYGHWGTADLPWFERTSGIADTGAQPPLNAFADHLGVNEHESHIGRFVGLIAPSMIGAALDQYVAGLEYDLAFIHQRNDLAGQHDRVVDRTGLVKAWMAGISAIKGPVPFRAIGWSIALMRERGNALLVWRIFDDAQHTTVLRRR